MKSLNWKKNVLMPDYGHQWQIYSNGTSLSSQKTQIKRKTTIQVCVLLIQSPKPTWLIFFFMP